jgi:hypothetical protein
VRRLLRGGVAGNEQLTAIVGALLILLLAIEGATLLNLVPLMTVHAFVGMLLIPVIALKLLSTGWRMSRYYLGGEEYVRRGPPPMLLRAVVAPIATVATVALFGTGVWLLAIGQTHGQVVALHKASFIVWLPAMSIHVLTRLPKLLPALRHRLAGRGVRIALVTGSLAAGVLLAIATYAGADTLQDHMSTPLGVDAR